MKGATGIVNAAVEPASKVSASIRIVTVITTRLIVKSRLVKREIKDATKTVSAAAAGASTESVWKKALGILGMKSRTPMMLINSSNRLVAKEAKAATEIATAVATGALAASVGNPIQGIMGKRTRIPVTVTNKRRSLPVEWGARLAIAIEIAAVPGAKEGSAGKRAQRTTEMRLITITIVKKRNLAE